MGIAVLGPLQVDGHPDGLSPRDRVVLSALVVHARRPMTTEALADALWGNDLPASWAKVVYGCVWRLRKVLGPPAIDKVATGYRLSLGDEELDHRVFERLVERSREALADEDPARSLFLVDQALGLWRGPALADVEEWEPGRVEATRLEGLRMDAEELRVDAEVRTGHASAVLEQARVLIAEAPFRERRWALFATALYQCGRQGEALAAVQRARTMLVGELGLDPGRELVDLEQRLLRQDPSLVPGGPAESSPMCPYRGLLPYDAGDADSFHGREDDVAACLRRLRESGVLVVTGPSGVGKSSLVRAGVVAALARADTPVLVTSPGAQPLASLRGLKPRGRQTLVVDQAEEAVTLCLDTVERERYFTALAAHVGAGGGLVLSLRADHLGDLAAYPDVARIVEDGLYLLGPMREPDLRRAIEGPARGAGLRLEPGLVDLVVREADGEPAALPMVSHVLRKTWERREGATLTVDGYKRTGGIQRAVSQSAEQLYDAMDETQRIQLRGLLLRLVVPSEAGDPVRTRVPRERVAVDEAHSRLVEQLVDARLVSIDGDSVQIAHEALVRAWPRLRGWLDDDVDGQRLFRHVAQAADAWDAMGRPDSELYRGARLTRTLEWRRRAQPDLSDVERGFLAASSALSDSELHDAQDRARHEHRVNRRLRGAVSGVAVLAVLAVVAGVLAARSSDRAEHERDQAQAFADLAIARQAGAVALEHEDLSRSLLLALSALDIDRSARGWDTLAAVLMRAPSLLASRPAGAVDMAVSPAGDLVAASRAGEGDGVLLLDATTLEPVPFADDTPASAIAFSPDGKLLAVAVNQWTGNDGSPARIDAQPVRLYDVDDGARVERQLGGFPAGASVEYDLDFSADGRRVVAAVDRFDRQGRVVLDTTATVWDLADPERPVLRVEGVSEYPVLKLSPDGSRLYVAATGASSDGWLRAYDVDTGRLVDAVRHRAIDPVTPGSGALSQDGSTLALGTGSRSVLVDTADLRSVTPGPRGDRGDTLDHLQFSGDGSRLAAATADGDLLVWDRASGALVDQFVGSGGVAAIDFSADGRTLFSGGDLVSTWDLTGRHELFATGEASDPAEFDVSTPGPDGRTLVRERDGLMWFVDERTGRETPRRRAAAPGSIHVWSPDGRWLLVSSRSGGSGVLRLWDAATGERVARRTLAGPGLVAFGSSAERVYVNVVDEQTLLVLDSTTLEPVRPPVELGERVLAVAPRPDERSVLAFSHTGAVLEVDVVAGLVETVAPPGTFPLARATVVALSPDGARVLAPSTRGDQAAVQLVDTTTWEPVGDPAPWNEDEQGGTFDLSPDGSQFASVNAATIAVYDAATGTRQASVPLPTPLPEARIRYLPDGSGLLVAGIEGSTWTLDTRRSSWRDRACEVAGRNLTRAEWEEYYPERPYEITCAQWPEGPAD